MRENARVQQSRCAHAGSRWRVPLHIGLCSIGLSVWLGCGTADSAPTQTGDATKRSGPATNGDFGELPGDVLLASVSPSATHSVKFWKTQAGEVTVIESYDVDLDRGSLLHGFRARRDSYAELYTRLSGASADAGALSRLRDLDAHKEAASSRSGSPRSRLRTPPAYTELIQDKTADEDWLWFQGDFCLPRSQTGQPDYDLCDGSSLTPNPAGQHKRWWDYQYEDANIALFNAADEGALHVQMQAWDCGFLELGSCDHRDRERWVRPRTVETLVHSSDIGFTIDMNGTSFGVHYLFWE